MLACLTILFHDLTAPLQAVLRCLVPSRPQRISARPPPWTKVSAPSRERADPGASAPAGDPRAAEERLLGSLPRDPVRRTLEPRGDTDKTTSGGVRLSHRGGGCMPRSRVVACVRPWPLLRQRSRSRASRRNRRRSTRNRLPPTACSTTSTFATPTANTSRSTASQSIPPAISTPPGGSRKDDRLLALRALRGPTKAFHDRL